MADLDIRSWLGLAWLLLAVGGLISIWRSRLHSGKVKAIWSAIVLLVPFAGVGAWFILGRVRRGLR
jgi:hypothetical protein